MILVFPDLVFSDGDILWMALEEKTGIEVYSCIVEKDKPAFPHFVPFLEGKEHCICQKNDIRVIIANLTATGIPYNDAAAFAKGEITEDTPSTDQGSSSLPGTEPT